MQRENMKVSERLNNIFKTRFGIDFEQNLKTREAPLLGTKIKLNPRDLLYLYLDIEKEFNICIPEEDIVSGEFSKFDGIVYIIKRQLDKISRDLDAEEAEEAEEAERVVLQNTCS